jgi:PAS domain S-box-containing protein
MPTKSPFGLPPPPGETWDRLLARVAFEAVWERDLQTDALNWHGNLESIFGYRRDEVVNHISWWRERVHPDDLNRVEQIAVEATRGRGASWSSEYRFRRNDGAWIWVTSRCAIERDADGRARRAVGAMVDISRLKDTESRLRFFTEQIPARACVTDRDLRVAWDAGAAFPDNPSAVGKTVPELYVDSPDRERVLDGCRRALAGESSRLEIDDGRSAAQLQLVPFRDPAGSVIGVVGIAFDITDRVRSEEKIRAGQRLLQQVLDTLPVGVIVLNRTGDILLHNPSTLDIWGDMIVSGLERWTTSKGFWRDSQQRLAADEWASWRALEQGETSRDELIDIEAFDGIRKTIKNYAAPIRDANGGITGAVVVNEDVTEAVRADESLRKTEKLLEQRAQQLQLLSSQLLQSQDEERRRIARELHDTTAQNLAALRLHLARLAESEAASDPAVRESVEESITLTDRSIAEIRTLSYLLHPPMIEEAGLLASLRSYAQGFEERSGIKVALDLPEELDRLPRKLESALFRIVQEGLTNIQRHSGSAVAVIRIEKQQESLHLEIEDGGRGMPQDFRRDESMLAVLGVGLAGMQERVRELAGQIQIQSRDSGTIISITLPISTS